MGETELQGQGLGWGGREAYLLKCQYSPTPIHTQFEGRNWISAEDAMKHPFFLSLGDRIHKLPDSEWGWGMDQLVGVFVEQDCCR